MAFWGLLLTIVGGGGLPDISVWPMVLIAASVAFLLGGLRRGYRTREVYGWSCSCNPLSWLEYRAHGQREDPRRNLPSSEAGPRQFTET